MQCPYCNYKESKVVDSRHTDSKSIRRRRECESCKKRFTTYEIIETTPIMVVKKDNSREVFDREKIKRGIIKSCEKRPVSIEQIESIISYIENEINKDYISEINTDKIGEMVMDKLKDIDEVSYVRFASVYRQFKDINTFVSELKNILMEKGDYLTINKEGLDFVKIAISTTNMDAKNLDDINRVLKDEFTLKNLSKNKQIHSNIVNKIDKTNIGQIIDGDAIITNEKNVPLVILTADCVPVILVDTENKAVGLAHAGWRGTYGKICEETLKSMQENYNTNPENVIAIIGPSIGSCCYEVSYDLIDKFEKLLPNADEKIYEIRDEKYYLNLWEVNTQILKEFGVLKSNIINMNICTSCNCDRFFSYRKHEKTPKRIGTFIEIK